MVKYYIVIIYNNIKQILTTNMVYMQWNNTIKTTGEIKLFSSMDEARHDLEETFKAILQHPGWKGFSANKLNMDLKKVEFKL